MTQQRISDLPTLDELRKLVETATPGKWAAQERPTLFLVFAGEQKRASIEVAYGDNSWNIPNYGTKDQARANAELIALAPALAARVIELSDQLAARRNVGPQRVSDERLVILMAGSPGALQVSAPDIAADLRDARAQLAAKDARIAELEAEIEQLNQRELDAWTIES